MFPDVCTFHYQLISFDFLEISALSEPVPPSLLFRSAHGLQFGRMLPCHFLQVHLRQSCVCVNVLVLFIKLLCTCAAQCAISQDIKYFSA